jgi:hypothetical protein
MEKKQSTPVEVLCHGLPDEFATFLNYAHVLSFDAKPNYSYIRELFCKLSALQGYHYDSTFDWNTSQSGIPGGSVGGTQKERRVRVRKVKEPCPSDRKYELSFSGTFASLILISPHRLRSHTHKQYSAGSVVSDSPPTNDARSHKRLRLI